ncbi:MAG TPA: MASE1 domain-containing protein [Candidatus Krumholzibacteria bacterium]|nr:MASE1 domain-containing protein [Candidatus Krumholzibacteria bacterium]
MSADKPEVVEPPATAIGSERALPVATALRLMAAAAVYFAVGKLGLRFAFLHASTSAIWPATGLAFAILLLWGIRFWPAIFVGAFLVNITTAGSWLNALLIALGNTLEAVVGAWLVIAFASGPRAFQRARDIVAFWFLACMAATTLSATIGVTSLCVTGAAAWSNYGALWATWWMGDAVGGFLAAALALLWVQQWRLRWTRRRLLETVVVYALVTTVTVLVFNGLLANKLFYILPALMWAAFRLGTRETAGAVAILSVISIWGTLDGTGPFVNISTSPNQALLRLQSYLAVLAITNLTVAAVVEEARAAADGLRAARDEMEERVRERTAMLSTANEALRVLAASVQGAQEDERRRVARELHDDLGQRLAALKLGMHLLEQELHQDGAPSRARLNVLVGDVDRTIAEVRRISYNLRPLALDDYGLSVAMDMLCKEFERVYGVAIKLQVNGSAGELHDDQLDIALYRVAQGALSNVAKHAAARTVDVSMTRENNHVVLSVQDDGRGFDLTSLRKRRDVYSGMGLIGMRERSEMLGGTFSIMSEPDHGTRVQVRIPLPDAHSHPESPPSDV